MGARELIERERGTVGDTSLVERLVDKWTPMLRGMPVATAHERYKVATTAMVYENQAKWLRSLSEEVRASSVGPYLKTIFPMLRRAVPNSILNDIASVQPLTGPVGALFYYDLVYGSTKGGVTKGDVFPRDFGSDFTSEQVDGEILVTGDGTNYGGAGAALAVNLAWTPVRPLNTALGYSVTIRELNATTGAVVQEAVDNGTGGFTGDSSAGIINYRSGSIQGFKFTTEPANGNPVKVYYWFDGELSTAIPQMNFDVKIESVRPTTRRAKMVLSQESIEDLKALHGMDAESDMIANMASQFTLEVDRTGIAAMMLASTATTGTFDRVPPSGVAEIDHLRSMFTVMSTVSGIVHKKTLRRPANFCVTSPDVMALFEQFSTHGDFRGVWTDGRAPLATQGFNAGEGLPSEAPGQFAIFRAGLLKNRWSMYEDPFFARDMMLLGLRGDSYLDAGFAYMPYVPFQITPGQYSPDDNGMRRGVRMRYAMKVTRPDYFAQIRFLNL